ncbi:MAG TPA: FG-GAP-like repeat-containing protein, partial [Candidatus Polarisedimenticolia bacterium]|nr:FG-GAP-like repeat-containing protein [Candidatus Polarisedimenticolia bacterium]
MALVLAACVSLVGAAPATQPAKGEALVRLNNLGIAYLAQYKAAEAEKQFREALALDPNYIPGRVNLGIAALAQVRYDEAIASFTKALAADPNNIHAHFNLSLIYKIQGKPAEALVAGLKALELDQRDPDIQYQVGSLYMATRDYDKAIQSFEAALRLDPNFLSAYYSMGRAYISKGDLDKGKKLIERHRELQAGTSATPAVGLRYGEQGKYSFAMEDGSTGGPAKALAEGALVFADVSATSGIAFVHGATVQMAALLKSGAGPAAASLGGEEALRSQIAPTMGSGLAVGDVNGDGLEDVFLANAGGAAPESAIYMNKGGMKFERAGGALAPALTTAAMSAAFGDLDGDSDPDLVVALLDRLVIFVNDGAGSFKDATASSGLAGPAKTGILGGLSLADVDHDGDLDIFAAGFLAPVAASNPAPKFPASWGGARSLLYINATVTGTPGAGPKFTETAASAGLDRSGRRTTGAVFGDFDNDRDIDAVVASPGDGSSLFSNQRDGTFKDLGASSGLPANAMILGLTAGDYDKDGRMDLAATTWDGGLPRLFKNVLADPGIAAGHGGGAFALDVSAMADVSRQIGTPQFGVAFTDVDNDGYLDLISVNGADV